MLFAIFPALGAAVWLLRLLSNPAAIQQEAEYLHNVLPGEALGLIQQQLAALTAKPGVGLSIGGVLNLVIALFTARTAAGSMIEALNAIYRTEETRGVIKLNAIALLFTAVAVTGMVLAVALVLILPGSFDLTRSSSIGRFIGYLRWPLLAGLAALALAVTYRYGPNLENPSWRLFTWGAAAATTLWLAASIGFSRYVAEFNSYDRVYGSLGAVVILLFWFWLTAFSALFGAQLDKQIEEFIQPRHR
jgi:membrane protein